MARAKREPPDSDIPVGFRLHVEAYPSHVEIPPAGREFNLEELMTQIGAVARQFHDNCQERVIGGKTYSPVLQLEVHIVSRKPTQTEAHEGEIPEGTQVRATGRPGRQEEIPDDHGSAIPPLGGRGDDPAQREG